MPELSDFQEISPYIWEIPQSYRDDMRVPARVFTSRELLEQAVDDKSFDQLVNATTLPGIVRYAIAMPDIHQGYGFPVGGVAATALPDGVISPGSIGYDINCGVRLLGAKVDAEELAPFIKELASTLYNNCPSGVGQGGRFKLTDVEMNDLLRNGARWCQQNGLATEDDVIHTEGEGALIGADPQAVSHKALDRGRDQLGTLGGGNHFLEVDVVTRTYNEEAADAYGLRPGQIVVQIHCGSRGLGHQICTEYVREFQGALNRYNIELPDRELVCAPLNSPEGDRYQAAMRCAANYAFANRQAVAHLVRESFEQVLSQTGLDSNLYQVYDVAHNIGKIETHMIDGSPVDVCVHRKGATRAFAPGNDEIPKRYESVGQPVLVPGSMGTASYVLAGTEGAMETSFGSSCHGAGRTMSRTAAKKQVWGEDLRDDLAHQGIEIRAGSMSGLAEEAPLAYKEVDAVIKAVEGAGLAQTVARLEPLAVIKG